MKQTIFLVCAFMLSTITFAQNGQLNSAKSAFDKGDYKAAISSIEAASEHKKTKDNPETWVYKAMIYSGAQSSGLVGMLGLDQVTEESTMAAMEKAKSLDTNGDYTEQLSSAAAFMINEAHNAGVVAYTDEQDYQKSVDMFLKKQALRDKFTPKAPADTIGMVVLGSAYVNLEQTEKAIPYYEQVKDLNYDDQGIYNTLITYYDQSENDEAYLSTLKDAQKMYPEVQNYMLLELDYYIKNGQIEEKLADLEAAAATNPDNANLPLIIASVYEQKEDYATQNEWAKKALAIQPDSFAANFNVGVSYFNQAVKFNDEMNFMTSNTTQEFEDAKVKRDKFASQAKPLFDKSYELKPDSKAVLGALVQYHRMYGNDELKAKFQTELDK